MWTCFFYPLSRLDQCVFFLKIFYNVSLKNRTLSVCSGFCHDLEKKFSKKKTSLMSTLTGGKKSISSITCQNSCLLVPMNADCFVVGVYGHDIEVIAFENQVGNVVLKIFLIGFLGNGRVHLVRFFKQNENTAIDQDLTEEFIKLGQKRGVEGFDFDGEELAVAFHFEVDKEFEAGTVANVQGVFETLEAVGFEGHAYCRM